MGRGPSLECCLMALSMALTLGAGSAAAADKPNVLLVVIDTLRADHLGAYGYQPPTSPRLDALAASGVRFAAAHGTSSWTAPSVASILTALSPPNHNLQLPTSKLGRSTPTMAEGFGAAGYITAAYSANAAFVSPKQGFDRGFVEFHMLDGGAASNDTDADVMPAGPASGPKTLKVVKADQVTSAAIDWLEHVDKSKPFFLYVHYFDPHGGYYPPREYAERFGVDDDSPMLGAAQKQYWKEKPPPDILRTLVSLYDGEVAFTDHEVGRLIDKLPQERPTLILVTADHGEEFMEHGGVSHARTLFEESVRVPMLFAGAGVAKGKVVTQPVSIADVWPTLAELTGLTPPERIDGRSLAASVRGEGEPAARPVFADMVKAHKKQEMIHKHAVLDASMKLIESMESTYSLYDLATDPGEKQDRIASDAARADALRPLLADRDPRRASRWRVRRPEPAPTVALSQHDKERMRALGYDVK